MRDGADDVAAVELQRAAIRVCGELWLRGFVISDAEKIPRARFVGQKFRGAFQLFDSARQFSFPQRLIAVEQGARPGGHAAGKQNESKQHANHEQRAAGIFDSQHCDAW